MIARIHVREKPVPPELRPVLVLSRVDGRISLVVPESVPLDELGPAPTDVVAVFRDSSVLRNTLVKRK